MTKEQIYDEQIYPLMARIIEICLRHRIAMLADFRIPSREAPDLGCTTALLTKAYGPADAQLEAERILWRGREAAGEVKSVEMSLS